MYRRENHQFCIDHGKIKNKLYDLFSARRRISMKVILTKNDEDKKVRASLIAITIFRLVILILHARCFFKLIIVIT